MSLTPSVSPVLLIALLLASSMPAYLARPRQPMSLQPCLCPLASPWTYPRKEVSLCLLVRTGSLSTGCLCLDSDSLGGPGPLAPSPGVPLVESQWRVVPGPSSPCCCLGSDPMHRTAYSPPFADHLARNLAPAHPSLGNPGGPSWRWHRADSSCTCCSQPLPPPASPP